jgi:16S rRNA (adenine1518-N6/adenine1519-N6)-dimethyltransferase
VEPALARRIVDLAGVGPGSRVVEVGPGLGSLTVALVEAGARVVAVEVDPALVPALEETVGPSGQVRVVVADAVRADWPSLLGEDSGPWVLVANLPYNVAVPVVLTVLQGEPRVERMLVMVQREVGERLCAGPGDPQYGAVSLRVAYRAEARVLRRVSRSVFWPRPNVDSVLVSLARRPPPVAVEEEALWEVVGASFAQRRKTMRGALVRLGLTAAQAAEVLEGCGVPSTARPEDLGLEAFACLAERWRELRPR